MDYESMKVDELKAELKKKGLSVSGRKADLISRLKDADGDNEEHEEKEEKPTKRKAPPKKGKAKAEESEEEEEEEEKEKPAKKTRGRAAAKKKEVEEEEEEEEEEEKPKPKKAAKKEKVGKAEKEEKEEDEEEEKPKAAKKKGGKAKVDKIAASKVPNGTCVFEDYDCMLNQTNIKNNNNKYYIIQVLENGGRYWTFNRWGRVGEDGQNKLSSFGDAKKAKADFEKKFKDKTKNTWADRANFEPVPGKYTMLEMSYSDDEDMKDVLEELDEKSKRKRKVRACSLPKPTQELVRLVSDHDMFKSAMKSFDIDVNKMPLGKISSDQIQKGYDILEEIEDVLDNGPKSKLERLCSQFYTNIPHDFGRRIPPLINTKEDVQKKKDMLAVLGDIEIAQGMFKDIEDKDKNKEEVDHPLDVNYKAMNAALEPVDEDSKEYKMIEKYLKNTCGGRKLEILDVFTVDRKGEQERFEKHDDIKERKLLWHGTNVAVIMAIMKTGLRIMPHSGGRVGRGLYFASENSKSANYVSCAGSTGIMLLNEVVLGKSHVIVKDDPSLTKAPKGFDSVLARGWTEPDPKDDTTIELGDKEVTVPVGKPIKIEEYKASYFTQSEYLVYQESQVRIRYLLKLKFN